MHSGKLVPMNTHWFASMMINYCNTPDCNEIVIGSISTLKIDTKNTHIQHFTVSVEAVCILGTVSVRHRANLPPATSRALSQQLWPSDLQAMYEIWIIPRWGRKRPRILCCVCGKRDGSVSERGWGDCLWDGKGMRNHYHCRVFMSPVLIWTHMLKYGCHPFTRVFTPMQTKRWTHRLINTAGVGVLKTAVPPKSHLRLGSKASRSSMLKFSILNLR